MKNYLIYDCRDVEDRCIVELLNECDMQVVQKQLIELGYIIEEILTAKLFKICKWTY